MPQPRVAVLLLNYNGRELTLGALPSVRAMTYPAYDVLVVDNGSTDGSFAAVAAAHPTLTQLRTEVNLGPAGGYNLGLAWALERDYAYILALNNDIEVNPEMLSELVRVAENDPRIGCVGPKTFDFWLRDRIFSAGGILRFKESVTRERGNGAIDRGQFDRDLEMGYVNGNGMLMRSEAVRRAGFWDPQYLIGIDDADWCKRIRALGYTTWYAHRAILYHMVSRSTGVYSPRRTFATGRGTAIFVRRYATGWQWLTFLVFAALAIPAAWLRELPRRNQRAALEKLRGYVAGLRAELAQPPAAPAAPLAAGRDRLPLAR